MFRYDDTGKLAQPGEKQVRMVVEVRQKEYSQPVKDYKGKEVVDKHTGKARMKTTHGNEIVKEIIIDPNGPNGVAQ